MIKPQRCPAENNVYLYLKSKNFSEPFDDSFFVEYWGDLDYRDPTTYVFMWDEEFQCVFITTSLYFAKYNCFPDGAGFFPNDIFSELIGEEIMESAFLFHKPNIEKLKTWGMKQVFMFV